MNGLMILSYELERMWKEAAMAVENEEESHCQSG
jgi:hypothetical protein